MSIYELCMKTGLSLDELDYEAMPYVAGSDPWDMEIPEEWEEDDE